MDPKTLTPDMLLKLLDLMSSEKQAGIPRATASSMPEMQGSYRTAPLAPGPETQWTMPTIQFDEEEQQRRFLEQVAPLLQNVMQALGGGFQR